MKNHTTSKQIRRQLRVLVIIIIVGLALSGITAFPIHWQFNHLVLPLIEGVGSNFPFYHWLHYVAEGIEATYSAYPFFGYGTDWLAYAHLLLALLYYGTLEDPVRNKWLFKFGLISCLGIVPVAVIAGGIRDIPFAWRMLDCCFGLVCAIPLIWALQLTKRLETFEKVPSVSLPQ